MKQATCFFAFCFSLSLSAATTYTETVDGIEWTYTVSDGKASVGGGEWSVTAIPTSTAGAITIPSTLGGCPVVSVGAYAFYGCSSLISVKIPDGVVSIGASAFNRCTNMTSVAIPDGVTTIGDRAFYDCSGLSSVTIPDSVTSIGANAFRVCSGLTSITIPDGVTIIESFAFTDCTGLTSITIPDNVTIIGAGAFSRCSGLTSVAMPDGVTSIDELAFSGCTGLTSITIPDGVTSIGKGAFKGCSGLTRVTIPDGVTSIGGYAFSGTPFYEGLPDGLVVFGFGCILYAMKGECSSVVTIPDGVKHICGLAFANCTDLTSVTIPDGVTSIGEAAFTGCTGLTSVVIPDGVTNIEYQAFYKCIGLTSVTIPDSVTSIGDCAFEGCIGLTSITIPDSVTSIGRSVFEGCTGLTSITIPDSVTIIGSSAFSGCSGLTSVTIPSGVTNIWRGTFNGCSGLTSVTIPNGVTNIDQSAFYLCSGLTSVTLEGDCPTVGKYNFGNVSSSCVVHLPYGNTTYSVSNGKWQGMTVEYYEVSVVSPITYTNLRGATNPNPATYQEGSSLTFVPPNAVTGYTFAYWTPSGITVDMTGAQTVRAAWTANSYSIAYNANGGSGTMAATAATYDSAATVAANGFAWTGHVFAGWATNATGEIVYAEGQIVTNLTAQSGGVVTLYAIWADAVVAMPTITPVDGSSFNTPVCTVTLECSTDGATIYYRTGGGSPKQTSTYLYKGPFEISETTIIRAFAAKDGWAKSEMLQASITKGELSLETAVDATGGITVTTGGDAQWSPISSTESKTGGKCAKSGAINDDENSWIQFAVSGAGTITFWAKVSCEEDDSGFCEFDHVAVYVDGVEDTSYRLDSEHDWTQQSVAFTSAGNHTVKIVYEKDESDTDGEDCAWVDGVSWSPTSVPVVPSVPGDPSAVVTGDAESGFTVNPSTTSGAVEVSIPSGVDAAKVTVEVSPTVESVTPHGATIKIVKGGHDITPFLDVPAADGEGAVATHLATVKEAIVKEAIDTKCGAEIDLKPSDPSIKTAPTRPGLTYTFSEGTTLEGMTQKAEKQGDGQPWTPTISVKDGPSGFYSIGVGK